MTTHLNGEKSHSTVTYTSENTFSDYMDAKIKTLRKMKSPEEATSMTKNSDGSISYHKDVADLEGDSHWYEITTVRTETLVIRETGKVVSKKEFEDIEYWGTSTKGLSYFVHRIIEEVA